jgi:hypothetical protein
MGLRTGRQAEKNPKFTGRQEKARSRNSRSQLAYTKRGHHWTTSRNILRHEGLKCVNEATNSLRWLKTEPIDKLFVRREVSGFGLSDEHLAETFLQHGGDHVHGTTDRKCAELYSAYPALMH